VTSEYKGIFAFL